MILSGLLVYRIIKPRYPFLFAWIWFNIWIAIYEAYVVFNRRKLSEYEKDCENRKYWSEKKDRPFWLDTWSEYSCFADTRYFNPEDFVHWIELGNAIIVCFIIIFTILGWYKIVYLLLLIQAYHCLIYFVSLIQSKKYGYPNIFKKILYLFVSSLWIIIPVFLFITNK
jgi:hypothetical protein